MPVHDTLVIAAFILVLLAAVFELPFGAPWPPSAWSHVLGWLGLSLFILSTRV